jgi:hypothetical protein
MTIPIINNKEIKPLENLKISQSLVIVTPTTGVSGTTEFQAQYIFDNVKAFKKGNWTFSIRVGSTGIPTVSKSVNNKISFVVPPHQSVNKTILKKKNIYIKIKI